MKRYLFGERFNMVDVIGVLFLADAIDNFKDGDAQMMFVTALMSLVCLLLSVHFGREA